MRFTIKADGKQIEAWSSELLSHDKPEHDPFRWQLADKIAKLKVGDAEMLHASYSGPDDPLRDRFDVENVLFYNVRRPGKGRDAHASLTPPAMAYPLLTRKKLSERRYTRWSR